jgi:ribosomal protein S18 acetylase RimI-like enzyme
MHIRLFRDADRPELVDLTIEVFGVFYEESFRAMVSPTVFEHQHGSWADDYRRDVPALHDPARHKHVAVAVDDTSEIVGFVAWNVNLEQRHGDIDMLAVRESVRRCGTGRALCEHAMAAMRAAGAEVVGVGTGGDWFHAPARGLYESLGFSLVPVAVYLRELEGQGRVGR